MADKAHPKTRGKTVGHGHSGRVPSSFTCPDCQGTLFLVRDHQMMQFRCRIGHLYSPESMLDAQTENVERLMWSAMRALEEHAEYTGQLGGKVERISASLAREYQAISRSSQQKAEAMRKLIMEEPTRNKRANLRIK
jgi:two-component system chemotaxis response regulator CheB